MTSGSINPIGAMHGVDSPDHVFVAKLVVPEKGGRSVCEQKGSIGMTSGSINPVGAIPTWYYNLG